MSSSTATSFYASSSSSTTTTNTTFLSIAEQEFLKSGVYANCRIDGRRNDEFRNYHLEITTTSSSSSSPPLLPSSHGSSRLIDPTTGWQLITSIKAELVTPAPNQPTQGVIEIQIDQHPNNKNNNRQYWKDIQNALQEHVAKSILESLTTTTTTTDSSSLCVLPGIAVWKLNIDLWSVGSCSSSSGAMVLDAASHAIRNTLPYTFLPTIQVPTSTTSTTPATSDTTTSSSSTTTTKPTVFTLDQLLVDSDIRNARPVVSYQQCVNHPLPLIVTVTILQHQQQSSRQYLLVQDATDAEEFCSIAQVHVAIVPSTLSSTDLPPPPATVQAVWKTGTGTIPMTLFPQIVQAAIQAVPPAIDHYHVAPSSIQQQQQQQQQVPRHQQHRTIHNSETASSSFLQAPIIIQ
jgi:exosome complex RNA-binding protein Rrp42 (RNase PH superfamily)